MFLVWQLLAPARFSEFDAQVKREIGLARWFRYELFRLMSIALAFFIAWRWADLAHLWLGLALFTTLFTVLLSGSMLFVDFDQLSAQRSRQESTSSPARIASGAFGLLSFGVWVYAWRGLAA